MEKLIEEFREQKEVFDSLKINYLYDEDIDVCNYVINHLWGFDIKDINYGNVISLDELISKSMSIIKIFGDNIYLQIQDIVSDVSIHSEFENKYDFSTTIGFDANGLGDIIIDSGVVDGYVIPKDIYQLSVYHMAHEHIHALKETNYAEYKDGITLGETVPLFLELIIYNPDEVLTKELIKFRMKSLLHNKIEYRDFDNLLYRCVSESILDGRLVIDENAMMCEFLRSRVGCYMNSFYYSLILYNMYKQTPAKILNLINKVLNREMTTFEMLKTLGLYGDVRGEIFEKEIKKIRKMIK